MSPWTHFNRDRCGGDCGRGLAASSRTGGRWVLEWLGVLLLILVLVVGIGTAAPGLGSRIACGIEAQIAALSGGEAGCGDAEGAQRADRAPERTTPFGAPDRPRAVPPRQEATRRGTRAARAPRGPVAPGARGSGGAARRATAARRAAAGGAPPGLSTGGRGLRPGRSRVERQARPAVRIVPLARGGRPVRRPPRGNSRPAGRPGFRTARQNMRESRRELLPNARG